MALVHKQVVDAHHAEVHHIIGALLDAVGYLLQLHLQILLSLFQAFEHSPSTRLCPAYVSPPSFPPRYQAPPAISAAGVLAIAVSSRTGRAT